MDRATPSRRGDSPATVRTGLWFASSTCTVERQAPARSRASAEYSRLDSNQRKTGLQRPPLLAAELREYRYLSVCSGIRSSTLVSELLPNPIVISGPDHDDRAGSLRRKSVQEQSR